MLFSSPSGKHARSILRDIRFYSESKRVEVLKCIEEYHISYTSVNPAPPSIESHVFKKYSYGLKNICRDCYYHKKMHRGIVDASKSGTVAPNASESAVSAISPLSQHRKFGLF